MSTDQTTTAIHHLTWTTSSYSGSAGGQCVEVARQPATVHVRDSKNTTRATLTFPPQQWAAFLEFSARGC